MAKYTLTMLELQKTYPDIYNNLFPQWSIFDNDETHKVNLQNSILEYFTMREIGSETPDLFQFYFKRRFSQFVEEYNRLGSAQLEVATQGWLTEYEEEETGENSGETIGNSNGTDNTTEDGTSSGSSTSKKDGTSSGTDGSTAKIVESGETDESETTASEGEQTSNGTSNSTTTSSGTSSNDTKKYEYPINGQVSTLEYSATGEDKQSGTTSGTDTMEGTTTDTTTTTGSGTRTNKTTTSGTRDETRTGTNEGTTSETGEGTFSNTDNKTIKKTSNEDTTETSTSNHKINRSGRRTGVPELYLKYIDAIKTIDTMWYVWLEPCFMQLF